MPLYYQVAEQLQRLIESEELRPGSLLGNEVALAEQLGLSRPTMRAALQYLVDRGLVARRRGVGTVVLPPRVHRPAELTSLYDDLERSGQEPRTEILSFAIEAVDEALALVLDLEPGTDVYRVERLRYADDEPLALMRNYVPVHLIDLRPAQLRRQGLYELLRAAGLAPRMASQTIGARAATAAQARQLGEVRGAPLLTMQRTAYDATGRAVEHGSHVYRASRYSFTLTLTRI